MGDDGRPTTEVTDERARSKQDRPASDGPSEILLSPAQGMLLLGERGRVSAPREALGALTRPRSPVTFGYAGLSKTSAEARRKKGNRVPPSFLLSKKRAGVRRGT